MGSGIRALRGREGTGLAWGRKDNPPPEPFFQPLPTVWGLGKGCKREGSSDPIHPWLRPGSRRLRSWQWCVDFYVQ